jgi:Zn-dependent peptidase ImmA (M78 family)/DNA-binding XRE family transcriptional regulator
LIRMPSTTTSNSNSLVSRRIIAAREAGSLTQGELSKRLGFKDRQTLSAIESGQRRVTAEELVAIADATKQDLDFFSDPFRLVGEGDFSYRAADISPKALDKFEQRVGGWLALWRQLGVNRGETSSPLRPRLAINLKSAFEEAQLAGESVRLELELGDVPAEKLARAVESRFRLLVLEVEMPKGVSGAAVQLATGDAILVNRAEPPGRQAFDLAHELFHVLTWDALPPERVDRKEPTGYKQKRTEQLADNFAAALLMPQDELQPRWEKRLESASVKDSLEALAGHFRMSTAAVGWRAVALGWLKKDELPKAITRGARTNPGAATSPLFSRSFMERMSWGIDRGEISVKRLLELLGMKLDEFRACCQSHGVPTNIGL